MLKISIWCQSYLNMKVRLIVNQGNYISLQRGMPKLYLETHKNTNMQIIFKLGSQILMRLRSKSESSHRSKRNEIHRVG